MVPNAQVEMFVARILESGSARGSLLLSGPEGADKELAALTLAKALLKSEKSHHPDLHLYSPEGKSGLHSIASIRQLIEEVGLPPFEASCKIFIIYEAERMLPTSGNALLKTLEEPNLDTLLILLSKEPQALLPTIFSRCRHFPFLPTERIDCANQVLIEILSERMDHTELMKRFVALEPDEKEEPSLHMKEIDALFHAILSWYRDRHLLLHGLSPHLLYYKEHLSALERAKELPLPPLEELLSLITECRLAYQRSIKLKHILEYLFLTTSF
jgi:DNA polymerase III subunit delta'